MYDQLRNALNRRHDPHTTRSQKPNETFTRTTRDDYIHVVMRMSGFPLESMNGHIRIKIKALDFPRRFLVIGFKYDEAAHTSGMTGDSAKILTADA